MNRKERREKFKIDNEKVKFIVENNGITICEKVNKEKIYICHNGFVRFFIEIKQDANNESFINITKIISPKEKNYINKDKAKTQRKNKLILFMLVVFLIFYYLLYYFF